MRRSPLEKLAWILILDSDDDDSDDLASAISLLRLGRRFSRLATRSGRYGPRGSYDHKMCIEFFRWLLNDASTRHFKAFLRVDKTSFWHLHDLIKDDSIFHTGTPSRPQRKVKYQLASWLIRMGNERSLKTSGIMAIAEGTVFLYVDRVTRAFRRIKHRHLAWPGPERRAFISSEMDEIWGFKNCIGIADGSYIFLEYKPRRNGYAYWCRKKQYGIIIQVTVDHRGIITSFDFGWPGSVQDSRVFRNSHLWQNRQAYFNEQQYILVDKGYPLTPFTIRPFTDTDLTNNPAEAQDRTQFNVHLSSLRVRIEHAFGRMKGRFEILRKFPGRDITDIYRRVESILIVHNILTELGDDPRTIRGYNGREDAGLGNLVARHDMDERLDEDMGGGELHAAGLLRRKLIMRRVLRVNRD